EVLREAVAAGLTVCRTWAFSDGGDQPLQVSQGKYDERVFQGLHFVIWEAQKRSVRLILSFVNNFQDFGGRARYVQWARDAGVAVNGEDDFCTNLVVKGYYKNHILSVDTNQQHDQRSLQRRPNDHGMGTNQRDSLSSRLLRENCA
ncbi:unnamed protein product, partial [Musa textilis]